MSTSASCTSCKIPDKRCTASHRSRAACCDSCISDPIARSPVLTPCRRWFEEQWDRHAARYLKKLATHCNTLQHTAKYCIMLQHTATHTATYTCRRQVKSSHRTWKRITLLNTAIHCSNLQHTPEHTHLIFKTSLSPKTLTAIHCHTFQHIAKQCNTYSRVAKSSFSF